MNNIQNKTAFGAMMAAIVAFCKTLIRTFTVLEDGVAMAESSVKEARRRLEVDLAIDQSNYMTKRVSAAALEQSRQQKALQEYASQSEEDKTTLTANMDRLTKLVNQRLAKLEVKEEE